jgi:hypothetical protein
VLSLTLEADKMTNTPHTDLYLRLGVNTQAWREFCRAEQLLAQRNELLDALQNIIACCDANDGGSLANAVNDARAAVAKATKE